jgi:hypothetical protein
MLVDILVWISNATREGLKHYMLQSQQQMILVLSKLQSITSRNQPKCNHSIYDYMQLVVIYD